MAARRLAGVVLGCAVGFVLACAAGVVLACVVAASAGADDGRLVPRPCWHEAGTAPTVPMRCATFEAAERPGAPGGRRVSLPVVVLDAGSATGDAILIPGGGGPGAPVGLEPDTVGALARELEAIGWASGRDVVIVDPRGAGLATPALVCPESAPVVRRYLAEDLAPEAEAELWAGAARACAARLRADGAALEAYDTRRAADDLEALRRALGYAQWDLWGTSYGARLALVFARAYPDSVRTLVLDSPDAPDADVADQPANFQRVLGDLFRRCARSPRCRRDAPDPAGALDRLLARLDRQPLRLEVASPVDLRPVPVLVTPEHLLEALFNALYDASRAHEIPLLLTAADRGSDDLLVPLIREYAWMLLDPRFADGLFDVISCRELLAHGDLDRLEREAAAHPWRAAFVGTAPVARAACAAWGVAPVPAEAARPVAWPGPALVLAGGLDPIIPPADARRTAGALPGGRLLEFPATGHAVEYHLWSCVDELIAGFLRTPGEALPAADVAACRAEAEAVEFWTLYPETTLPPPPLDPALERAASLPRRPRRPGPPVRWRQ